jgi:hypothetical protein
MEMVMILTLDSLASRYGMLPSQVICQASTFDLVVMDAAMSYENHLRKKEEPGHVPDIPLEDLIRMQEQVGR